MEFRNNRVNDIVSTENTYVEGLNLLITEFIDPLESNQNIITSQDHQMIFAKEIKIIHNFHNKLLTLFQDELNHLKHNKNTNIGKIFIEHSQVFKMYKNYVNSYNSRRAKIVALRGSNRKFDAWCSKSQLKCNKTLDDLLISIVQRIPRYELLIKALIKETRKIDIKNDDLNDLELAYKETHQIAQYIDKMEHQLHHQQRENVKKVKNKFEPSSLSIEIIIPSRLCLRESNKNEGIIKYDENGNQTVIYMVLFNDSIIYGHSHKKYKWFGGTSLYFDNIIPFNVVFEIENMGQSYKGLPCIKLLSSKESIFISFSSEKSKTQWMHEINDALRVKLSKRVQKHNKHQIIQKICKFPSDYDDNCMVCDSSFSKLQFRRHICLNCDKLVCGACLDYKMVDPDSKTNAVIKICFWCYAERAVIPVKKKPPVTINVWNQKTLAVIILGVVLLLLFNK